MKPILFALFVVGFSYTVSAESISLVSETNMPEPNQEITVQIQTDTPLGCMGLFITVTGCNYYRCGKHC